MPGANALLALGILLLTGAVAGTLSRRMGLPSITGQIIAGVLMGPSVLHVLDRDVVHGLAPVTHFALGLMALTVGAHLNFRRLRNALRRLFYLLLAEALLVPLLVFGGLSLIPGLDWSSRLLLGTIAVATAPATIVALVREARAKGVFVKTLVAAVALNNFACILLFEGARVLARLHLDPEPGGSISTAFGRAALPLVLAAGLGVAAALAMHVITLTMASERRLAAASMAAILLTSGLALQLGLSPLLACLCLGLVQSNLAPAQELLADRVFNTFAPSILAIFFTLAGIELTFDQAGQAGLLALVYFVARAGGKLFAVHLSMSLASATETLRRHLGLALLPQAGLAIGLVILLQEDPTFTSRPQLLSLLMATVLTAVTMNEIAGPIMTRLSLGRAGEVGKDRTRLIDFLQEENIVVDLQARTMDDAIRQLTKRLMRTHKSVRAHHDEFLRDVLDREEEQSTRVGSGLAIPHADLPGGTRMLGAMGISKKGLKIPTPDDLPVHCIVLLATVEGERDRHLEVLATLSRVLGRDPTVRKRLYEADSAAHAYEVLHGERSEDLNRFLDRGEENPAA